MNVGLQTLMFVDHFCESLDLHDVVIVFEDVSNKNMRKRNEFVERIRNLIKVNTIIWIPGADTEALHEAINYRRLFA